MFKKKINQWSPGNCPCRLCKTYIKSISFIYGLCYKKTDEVTDRLCTPILEPLARNDYTIHDSFAFAKDVTSFDSSLFMASLDVESLFTNIPLEETINNCTGRSF